MASIIKIHEAKTHLSRIVEEVAAGPIKAAGREKIFSGFELAPRAWKEGAYG